MRCFQSVFRRFCRDDRAVAAIEAGFIFPVLVVILCGMIDTGMGLVANQKMVNASQMVADILAREDQITDGEMNDAVVAGQLAMMPYGTQSFGVHVAGIQYNGANATPVVRWQDMVGTTANPDVAAGSRGLGLQNEGVLAVTTRYRFQPIFSFIFTGPIEMEEVAYVRGRRGLFITRVRG
jgi:Flp pilus assembly protein TadG